jgi:hypothetical protein
MTSWKKDCKFPVGMCFHFGTLKFASDSDGELVLQAQNGEQDYFRFPLDLKNSMTMLLGSIRAWGSHSRTLLETDLSIDLLSDLVAPMEINEPNQDPNACKDDSSTDDYPIILGGYQWDMDVEACCIDMVGYQD